MLSVFALILSSVLREGSETALFTFAASPTARTTAIEAIALGAVAATVVGLIVFKALAKIPLKLLFTVTSLFLIFVAAGMASGLAEEVVVLKPVIWLAVFGTGAYLMLHSSRAVAQK
jgi:high-affinity Fe2+/Pb2+ permease